MNGLDYGNIILNLQIVNMTINNHKKVDYYL